MREEARAGGDKPRCGRLILEVIGDRPPSGDGRNRLLGSFALASLGSEPVGQDGDDEHRSHPKEQESEVDHFVVLTLVSKP